MVAVCDRTLGQTARGETRLAEEEEVQVAEEAGQAAFERALPNGQLRPRISEMIPRRESAKNTCRPQIIPSDSLNLLMTYRAQSNCIGKSY
jgi:hypothetical protein